MTRASPAILRGVGGGESGAWRVGWRWGGAGRAVGGDGAGRGRTFRVRFQRFPRLRVLLQGTKRELQVLARRVPRAQLERDRLASVQISYHERVGWRFRSLGRRAACLPAPSDHSALGWVALAIVLLNYSGRQLLLRLLLLPSGRVCPGSSSSGEGLETGDGRRLYLGPSQVLRGPSGSEHPHTCLYPNGRNDLLTGKLLCDVAIGRPGVWQVGDVDGVEARCGLRLVLLEEERHPQRGCWLGQWNHPPVLGPHQRVPLCSGWSKLAEVTGDERA